MNQIDNPIPKVSICCAWYNRADYIRDTLDSLLAQNLDSFEIVLVNDGSKDPRVREILDGYSDPRLTIIHQENTGFVVAMRRAIDASRGEYIAIQGAGDVSFPDRLRRQAAALDAEPSVGVVGAKFVNVVFGGEGDGTKMMSKPRSLSPRLEDFVNKFNAFSHGEVMFRRSVYDAVGGYRPFFVFAQDRDLWIRMGALCEFRIVNEFLYERRIFNSDGIAANRSKLLLQQGLSNFARQCHYDRLANGKDFVDLYGQHAGIFRRPAPDFANFCAKQALISFAIGNDADSRYLSRIAWQERRTPKVIVAVLSLTIAERIPFAARILRATISRAGQSQIWRSMPGAKE